MWIRSGTEGNAYHGGSITASMGIRGLRYIYKKNNKPCLSIVCACVCVLAGGDIVRKTGHQKEFCIRDLINLLS